MTTKAIQPLWHKPTPVTPEPVLRVYNSLTRTKDEFVPLHGRRVDWYNCGPTVYDAAHMGHARNYLTQDIIRRVLRDYFAYDVNFVQNVTDLDDKIIVRAREEFLLKEYRDQHPTLSAALKKDIYSAFSAYFSAKLVKSLPEADKPQEGESDQLFAVLDRLVQKDATDETWAKEARAKDEKFGLILASLTSAKAGHDQATDAESAINSAKDVLAYYLDRQSGHTVTDPSIFRSLAAYWEDDFNKDMCRLGISPPDTVTRVSEYVPEIVAFVERIIRNGFAYEHQGNVWFDVGAFEGAKSDANEAYTHVYAKLAPWSKGNRDLLLEGEGSLTVSNTKRSAADFALWKSTKPGEPSWPSPWGPGRPGWHIECSVMASAVLGTRMDIHSGGVDLVFPHHDNEIAQAEACHDCKQWVNYFLHTGHLHIQGLKMSKSLKNFITIDEALQTWTRRQLRLAFMMQVWSAKMDLTPGVRSGMETIEETFNNFFRTVKAKISDFDSTQTTSDGNHYYDDLEKQLMDDLHKAQYRFRVALCDSFNTPDALTVLTDLVSSTNVYLGSRPRPRNIEPLKNVAKWITRMLDMFGLGEGVAVKLEGAIGWGEVAAVSGSSEEVTVDKESLLMPYLRTLSGFRDQVRQLALSGASAKDLLELCDGIRDNELVDLGVALDDQEDGKALVKLVPREELLRARQEKLDVAAAKAARKAASAAAAEQAQQARVAKSKISPRDMFKPPHVDQGVWSEWDADGIPVKDGSGEEVSKAKGKKMRKEWEAQKKLHDGYLASL